MSNPNFVNINPQLTTVCAFLGGATFTALIVITQSSSKFATLNQFLIPLTAIASFLFILVAIGAMKDITREGSVHISFYYLTKIFLVTGVGMLMVVISMIVYEYVNQTASFVVLTAEMIGMALLSIFTLISDDKRRRSI